MPAAAYRPLAEQADLQVPSLAKIVLVTFSIDSKLIFSMESDT
jgi:hypothetical protein